MKYAYFLILVTLHLGCQQPDSLSEITADDIPEHAIQFLEEILTDSSQAAFVQDHYYVLSDVTGYLPPIHLQGKASEAALIAEALQEEDEAFIEEQLIRQHSFSVVELRNKGFTMVPIRRLRSEQLSSDSLWNYVNQYYDHGFYSVSLPVFSSNFKRAYVRLGQLCGPACGGGETRIYKYEDGIWELVDVVEVWVI